MAGTGPDRDGLELDVLQVSVGPVLPGWPTGLVMHAAMQGDVLSDVTLAWSDDRPPGQPADPGPWWVLDAVAQFLLVAGLRAEAQLAATGRDDLRSREPDRVARGRRIARTVARCIRRSAALRWSVRGVGILPGSSGPDGDGESGDVWQRVTAWCDALDRLEDRPTAAGTERPEVSGQQREPVGLAELAAALEGAELATARLTVASADLRGVTVALPVGRHHE